VTRFFIYLFSFSIPLSGILGFKLAPICAVLLLIVRMGQVRDVALSKTICILFLCFIMLLLVQAFRELDALILATVFTYYFLVGVIFGTFSEKYQLDIFYKGYVHGIITACLIFYASLFNGGVSNTIIDWQLGTPVNLSGMKNPNGWAPFLILAVAANDYVFRSKKPSRLFLNRHFVFLLLILGSLLFTYSRAAILSLIVYFLIAHHRKLLRSYVVIGLFFAVFLTGDMLQNLFLPLAGEYEAGTILSNKEGSLTARSGILIAIFELPWDHFFIGNGYGTSKILLEEIQGFSLSLHNVFLAILVELGFFQLLIFVMICAYPFINVHMRTGEFFPSRYQQKYILAGVLASFLYWMFHESHINTAFWAFYFCLMFQISGDRLQSNFGDSSRNKTVT